MTQLLIDIAALMPSDSPLPGSMLPATGVACACASGQDAPFADALAVLLGQTGQPALAATATGIVAGLPAQSLLSDEAIQWFGENTTEAEPNLQTEIKPDNSKQQNSGDLSQFLFSPVVSAELPVTPLTITLDDESVEIPAFEPSKPEALAVSTEQPVAPTAIANIEFDNVENSGVKPVLPEQVSSIQETESQVSQESTQKPEPIAASIPSAPTPEFAVTVVQSKETAPAELDVPAPTTTVDSPAPTDSNDATIAVTNNRGEAPPKAAPASTGHAPVIQPDSDAKAAVESFARQLNQINDEGIPLKVEITPGQHVKPDPANPESATSQSTLTKAAATTSDLKAAVNAPASESHLPTTASETQLTSPVSEGSIVTAKPSQPVHQVHEVHQVHQASETLEPRIVAPNDVAKTVPLVATPAKDLTPKTRTPIQPIDEFTSNQAPKHTVTGKSDIGALMAKPAAAAPPIIDTPARDAIETIARTPVKTANPLEVPARTTDESQAQPPRTNSNTVSNNQSQPHTTHAASSAGHTQAPEHAERAAVPPPVRFEVEIPKPLRVPGQIRVHLDPPELGQVRIDLASRGDGIIGSLRFQSEQARHIVEREIGQLQKTLQDAGVRVERLEVLPAPPGNSRTNLHTNMNNQQSWSQNTTSQNAFNGGARGHAGMPSRNPAQNEQAQASTPATVRVYPTMHAGTVNLVA